MRNLRFEWDERKNAQSRRKHGVSFEEAQTVFFDDRASLRDDPDEEGEADSSSWDSAPDFVLSSCAIATGQTIPSFESFQLARRTAMSAAIKTRGGAGEN